MFSRLMTLIKAWINALLGRAEDPAVMLEQQHQELQNSLIQYRQAVAQAIAEEKRLEQQLQKNKDQSATWQNRAAMAVQQGQDDLGRQALQRKQQHAQAISELEGELGAQKERTGALRAHLTDLETQVQKVYTKKQVLIARDKAAQATAKASELLAKTSATSAMSVIEKMEQKVQEREAKAQALRELGTDTLEDKFKKIEVQPDIEAELMALKGELGMAGETKLIVQEKEPALIETREEPEAVEAGEVKEVERKE